MDATSTKAPLLEREAQLARLDHAIAQARGGEGRLIFIEGSAGVGKTRLLGEAQKRAAQGMLVLSGRGTELERELPFGVVTQMLEPVLRSGSAEERQELFSGAAAFSQSVLERGGPNPEMSLPDAGFSRLHGLYWLVSNLADRQPLLLCVDDAQWADESSLRFLAFLATRLADLRAAVALTVRLGDRGANEELLSRIAFHPVTEGMRVSPLSLEASGVVLGRMMQTELDQEFVRAVHEAVAGNPFYLRELARELVRESIEPTEENARRVRELGPRAISRVVLIRLAQLSKAAPLLAGAVAVLGDDARPDEAAVLGGLERETAIAAADELSQSDILRRGHRLSFIHPIVRNAAYHDIAPRRRSELHRRAAWLLRDAGAPPERIAAHLLSTDSGADPETVEALRAAARVGSRRGSPQAAARYLRRALEEPPPAQQRPHLLVELGSLEARAGDLATLDHLRSALDEAAEPYVRVWAAVELGQVLAYMGDFRSGAEVVRGARSEVEDTKELARPLEMMLLVMAETDVAARDTSRDLLDRAAQAVERLGSAAPRGLAAIVALERALVDSDAPGGAALAELAFEEGQLLEEQTSEAPHPYFAAGALVVAGHVEAAERHLTSAMEEARRRGSARGYAFSSAMRAWARCRNGALDAAEADARACLDMTPGLGWELFQVVAASALADVLLERGQLEAADAVLERFADAEQRTPGSILTQPLRETRARVRIAQGEPEKCLIDLAACAEWEERWGAGSGAWVPWRPAAALAQLRLGNLERARELSEDELKRARRFGVARRIGLALRAYGLVRGGEEAIALLRQAVAALETAPSMLDQARGLTDLGAALRRANRRAEARAPLRQALERAHRCGAKALEQRVLEELAAAGARTRKPFLTGAESLTASERRVAEMAANGMSNREIAQALFVTKKTVETQLRSAYRKLEIGGRGELTQALAP